MTISFMNVSKESYWQLALDKTETAIETKALIPLTTIIDNSNFIKSETFEIRKLIDKKKLKIKNKSDQNNPFLPWDPRLEIATIGNKHVLILNKYPVQYGHMLLITSNWSPQSSWLNHSDWNAVSNVENNTSGLWFFNSGPKAGASQGHKHIQLLPRSEIEAICPRENWIKSKINQNQRVTTLEKSVTFFGFSVQFAPAER